MSVRRPADTRDESGKQVTLELHDARAHGERARIVLVVADRDEQPPESATADVSSEDERDYQKREREEVVGASAFEGVAENDWPARIASLTQHPRLAEQPR